MVNIAFITLPFDFCIHLGTPLHLEKTQIVSDLDLGNLDSYHWLTLSLLSFL